MEHMHGPMGEERENCPFSFSFDPARFRVGDTVSYRVPERFDDFPFVGRLVEVHADYVLISPDDPLRPGMRLRASRVSRPVVSLADLQAAMDDTAAPA